MINRTVLVGRLTKDPELRYTPNGIASCRFQLAVNRTFTNQEGERDADFISCQAWRKQAENLANYMRKGNLIGIEGRIQTGSYEGQNGQRVYTTDVVADSVQFLEPRSGTGGTQNAPNYQSQPNPYQQQQNGSQGQYGGQQPNHSQASYSGGQPQQQYGQQQPQHQQQYQQQQSQFQWPSQQNQQPTQQPNYTRVDEDPFANSKGQIEVSEDDLPF